LNAIEELVEMLYAAEGYDLDGDRSYRVHIFTAEGLIKKAYRLGKSECIDLTKGVKSVKMDTYRSSSMVNQNNDMARITINFKKKENMRLYRKIKGLVNGRNNT
jgi:hypothetical protein